MSAFVCFLFLFCFAILLKNITFGTSNKKKIMNDKQKTIYEVLNIVVECCSMDIDGQPTVTAQDVLGKSRQSNIVMTRCIYITEMMFLGYTTSTVALILHRSETAIRHLLDVAHQFRITSNAYRLAEAEATIRCRDLIQNA